MPVSKNQSTTSTIDPVASERQRFHEHLHTLMRHAVRVVIEEVMREELTQFLAAAWGESTPERKGYRNGTYTRDLATSTGPIEDLHVPRDREGQFHTEVFERYQRYEPQVAEGLTQMFVRLGQYSQSGRSGSNAHGCGTQCQQCQSAQPDADGAI